MPHIYPVPGLTVPDPYHDYKPLPVDGRFVPWNQHWEKQLAEGAITLEAPPNTYHSPTTKPSKATL
jgi:hypothetical protein